MSGFKYSTLWRQAFVEYGHPDWTAGVLAVLHALQMHTDNETAVAWPSQKLLAAETRLRPETVSRKLKEAQEAGWLSIRKRGPGRSNWYQGIIPPEVQVQLAEDGKDVTVIPKNLRGDLRSTRDDLKSSKHDLRSSAHDIGHARPEQESSLSMTVDHPNYLKNYSRTTKGTRQDVASNEKPHPDDPGRFIPPSLDSLVRLSEKLTEREWEAIDQVLGKDSTRQGRTAFRLGELTEPYLRRLFNDHGMDP